MRKLTVSIAAATLATAGVALAAPGMMPQGDMTRAQAQERAAERFAKMDINSDGKLDTADREARRAAMVARLDTNKDGTVSAEERAAAKAARGANRPEGARGGKRAEGGDHAGHRMGGGKRGGPDGRDGRMGGVMGKMADANGDGAITLAEFTAGAMKRFDMADADRNGTVTQTERKAAHEAMRAQWQARKAAQPAT